MALYTDTSGGGKVLPQAKLIPLFFLLLGVLKRDVGLYLKKVTPDPRSQS